MEFKLIDCSYCGGTGEYKYSISECTDIAEECDYCGGRGKVLLMTEDGDIVCKIKII